MCNYLLLTNCTYKCGHTRPTNRGRWSLERCGTSDTEAHLCTRISTREDPTSTFHSSQDCPSCRAEAQNRRTHAHSEFEEMCLSLHDLNRLAQSVSGSPYVEPCRSRWLVDIVNSVCGDEPHETSCACASPACVGMRQAVATVDRSLRHTMPPVRTRDAVITRSRRLRQAGGRGSDVRATVACCS